MILREKFQEWLEQADFDDIIMAGFMTILISMCLIGFIVAIFASIATILT